MAKYIKLITYNFLLLLSFTSCQKEEIPQAKGAGSVTFTVEPEEVSRNTQSGTFEKGDAIGVFAIEPKTGVYWGTNNRYIFDGNKFVAATEGDDIIVTQGTDFDFYVYYPYQAGQTDITNITHSAGHQQNLSGWLQADFMTATYTDAIQNYTVPLHFKHRLSTVEVRVERNDGVTGAMIENVEYASRFNLLTGTVTTDNSRKTLSMYLYNKSGTTTYFRATIPAQTLTTASNYIQLTGSSDVRLATASNITTEAGKVQKYNIDYKKEITIQEYSAGGKCTGAGLYNIGDNCTVTSTVNPGYEFVGWFEDDRNVSNSTSYTFSVSDDRNLVPKYRNYSAWSVSLTASPSQIASTGGTATLSTSAIRDVLVNGVKQNTESGTPTLSGGGNGFSLSGTTVTVGENTSSSSRSCTFTATIDGASAQTTVTQAGASVKEEYFFNLTSGNTLNSVESDGGSIGYTVESYKIRTVNGKESRVDVEYSASSDSNWITAGKTSATVAENPNTTMRNGTITLRQAESGKTITLTVRQQKKVIIDIG